jgi:methionyl-tRNA formyltransferase
MNNSKNVPFAFFGTPYVARDTLALLIKAGYAPEVVVTSPDSLRGRGLIETPCDTKLFALERGLHVLSPHVLDQELVADIRSFGAKYAIVVAYGKLLPQTFIDAFPLGVLNIHYSLLPKYRGASPVEAALLNGDRETGVTIQRMVLKMDAGDILAQRTLPIPETDTVRELRPRLIEAGAELLIDILPEFTEGLAPRIPQDESQVTVARKIAKEEGELSLPGNDEANWRKYRAYLESPGTYFFAAKEDKRIRVKVTQATYQNATFVVERIIPEGRSEQEYAWLTQNGWTIVS